MDELLPKHIAIIMDGNRRWARQRNLPVKMGHKEGAETLKKAVRYANKRGIEYITVYAFLSIPVEIPGLPLLSQHKRL